MLKHLFTAAISTSLCISTLAQTGSDTVVPLGGEPTLLDAKSYVDTYDPALGVYDTGKNAFGEPTFTTGNRMPKFSAPSGIAENQGVVVYDKTSVTLSEDLVCDALTLKNWATLTIEGDVTIVVNDAFAIENQSNIVLAPEAKLTIYCLNKALIKDHCRMNVDTARPGDLRFYKLGDQPLIIENQSELVGMVYASETTLRVTDGSDFYGGLKAASLYLANRAACHFTAIQGASTTVEPLYD